MKNEKKQYEKATAEIVYVDSPDVILTSGIDLPDIPLAFYSQNSNRSSTFSSNTFYDEG